MRDGNQVKEKTEQMEQNATTQKRGSKKEKKIAPSKPAQKHAKSQQICSSSLSERPQKKPKY